MHLTLLVLSLLISAEAPAGGIHARIEGPGADGVTYTVRTSGLSDRDRLEPWALAEGVVDGRPQSRLIRLESADEHGVYRFMRTWPRDGQWMIRLNLGHPPAPATVATLRTDGTVERNDFYFQTDGVKECRRALKKYLKGHPGEDGC
jgi:hypothetical protein